MLGVIQHPVVCGGRVFRLGHECNRRKPPAESEDSEDRTKAIVVQLRAKRRNPFMAWIPGQSPERQKRQQLHRSDFSTNPQKIGNRRFLLNIH
jgi:hypothetical protein